MYLWGVIIAVSSNAAWPFSKGSCSGICCDRGISGTIAVPRVHGQPRNSFGALGALSEINSSVFSFLILV